MVQINFAAREINCKVVYYGPGRSGKTTNLEQVHVNSPKHCVGEMVSIATETDRTLFFDFLPLDIGKVAGMQVRFQLYTVPGQVYYNATRKLVLQGVDGVIFVADSQHSMMEENIESLQNLHDNLKENGYDPDNIPLVFQWNKQDLPDLSPAEELEARLNPNGHPSGGSVAFKGKGVFDTLKQVAVLVLDKLNKEYGGGPKEDEAAKEKAAEQSSAKASAAIASQAAAPKATPAASPSAPRPVPAMRRRMGKPAVAPSKAKKPVKAAKSAKKATREEQKSNRWIWITIILAIVVVAALAFWVLSLT